MSASKRKTRDRDRRRAAEDSPTTTQPPKPAKPGWFSQAVFRESVEAVAIAFILAFLFRTFEAEAFVIPTGSMATTLMGRHKDVECPVCGYHYQVSASNGLDAQTGVMMPGSNVIQATCPMCGYQMDTTRDRSFNGDRILVNKFIYCFEDPRRWDVAVFKYPEEARTNFIKRIVGLPNETARIHHGDLFVRREGETEFSIARKPPAKLRSMLKTVYDNDREQAEKLLAQGWPARWQPADASNGWVVADDHKSFSTDGASGGEAWLRYRHYVPNRKVWEAIGQGGLPYGYEPRPQLISDFCAYNDGVEANPPMPQTQVSGLHWVGDLAVSCTVEPREAKGQLVLELVEGGRRMQCRVDLATGQAQLTISGDAFQRTGATPITRPGTHEILFANVDDQLRLWVDGRLVQFDGPTTYGPLDNTIPTQADLEPVGIAAVGADMRVSHVKVLRDLYYIAVENTDGFRGGLCDYRTPGVYLGVVCTPESVAAFLSNPSLWQEAFSERSMRAVEFPLGDGQFLMLGDNSAQSKDSRLWGYPEYYVDRELLVGKAMFIYWPHSWDEVSIFGKTIPFPFFPNFKRMEFVR